jgi:hypothetical protein
MILAISAHVTFTPTPKHRDIFGAFSILSLTNNWAALRQSTPQLQTMSRSSKLGLAAMGLHLTRYPQK